VCKGQGDSDEV
jgi:hypothetical protein